MKKLLLIFVGVFVALIGVEARTPKRESLNGEEYLKSLKGVYVELFSQKSCLNPKFDDVWRSAALKYTDADKVDSVIAQIQGCCLGTKIGADAVAFNKQHNSLQFCCAFLQDVAHFEIKGRKISGYDINNNQKFSHNYHFLEKDANGNRIFESDDDNLDEFRYFWFMPDSPKTTYHIEFRYGSDKSQFPQMMTGKYAFWVAAGVREGHENEWRNGIALFVEERLKSE